MLFVTWRLQGSLRQKPHCASAAAVDRLLDRKSGPPQMLADPRLARMVERCLRRHNGNLYHLRAWVIMHNHVHLMMEPLADVSCITQTVMDETEREARKVLWARESYEANVAGREGEVSYWIESHPVRAGLAARAEEWRFSSAGSKRVSGRAA